MGDSHIYMVKDSSIGKLPEWRPIALITLRQVYENTTPMWYLWDIQPSAAYNFIGKYLLLEGALNIAENLEIT